ncbi:hypothetical protein K4A83_13240 [Spirulina subsalsa FACHB-351]|uniref:Uncharacterized protein n=1 Tax=Spirulina subsalsa FACHB-351 TaxID=234711 RepID=A0ABT3L7S2_9CYAN|nr:hypothetical protein [Spirulina subsalsa]MCW6037227.1 hypothetical protein [Spirulina subsalsa FACHB-351]
MERGLLWLPLLAAFIGLAWAGWNEYQKLAAYERWAEQFDKAKYDIYAVLGLKGDRITWGKPTRQTPINLQTFSLQDVEQINLLINQQPVPWDKLDGKGSIALQFQLKPNQSIEIPFTDAQLAAQWGQYLLKLSRS